MKKTFSISTLQVLEIKKRKFARYAVTKAMKSGILKKASKCYLCEQEKNDIEAHHRDYGKYLDVTWLCRKCHGLAHRKGHALNPDNNRQTPMPYLDLEYNTVPVTISLPIRDFIALQEFASEEKKSIAKIIKENIYKSFDLLHDQLEFNFMKGVMNDVSQTIEFERVSGMVPDQKCLRQ